jgi:predicted amidophosphoribosyltransferase
MFLVETGLDDGERFVIVKDICPGCGNKLKPKETECTECGLCFGGE